VQTAMFSLPLQPGQFDRIRQHQQEIVTGHMAEANLEHWSDVGLTVLKMYHQTDPAEALIFLMEGDDLASVIDAEQQGHKPVDAHWVEFFREITGGGEPARTLPELLIDWHHEEGHKAGT
jgi:hypothetical protein